MGNKVLSAENQQERVRNTLNPWYIVGFVEGEGTFHVAFHLDPRMKHTVKVIPEFHVNQSYLRLSALKEIQQYFSCGYIRANHVGSTRDTTYVYVVRNREDLFKKIVPFFLRYPLRSIKQESFDRFAKVVELMVDDRHRTKEGLRKIINLAYQMNIGGIYRVRKKEELFKALQSSETIR